ncbi:hypothetical protein DEO72_LG11g867 [Vigna unguiculata]|uniref:Uncharacterized protein n=1 Tax=Vigna unguiculata TaxID=3917 RepID=A0A4D6NMS7_VIGUN|nr:hypothetical protein DEO72_LG11g867 [Vigna unguiculata]
MLTNKCSNNSGWPVISLMKLANNHYYHVIQAIFKENLWKVYKDSFHFMLLLNKLAFDCTGVGVSSFENSQCGITSCDNLNKANCNWNRNKTTYYDLT